MKAFVTLLICGLLPVWGLAQIETTKRPVTVKLNPLALLGPDGTVQGAVEIPTGARGAVQAEFGYGAFRSLMNFDPVQYSQKKTTRARLEYRFYNPPKSRWPSHYKAVELFYKQVDVIENLTVGHECVYSQCGYFQVVQQPVTRYVMGAYLKAGQTIPLWSDKGDYRFVLDIFARIGLRRSWVIRDPAQPYLSTDYEFTYGRDAFEINRFVKSEREPYAIPDLQVGIMLGYQIGW